MNKKSKKKAAPKKKVAKDVKAVSVVATNNHIVMPYKPRKIDNVPSPKK